jgi:hypothetical protein
MFVLILCTGGGKTLVINKSALTRLLHEAVNVTQNVHSLEVLIDLYAQLRQVISRYHRLWNRSKLPQVRQSHYLQPFAISGRGHPSAKG